MFEIETDDSSPFELEGATATSLIQEFTTYRIVPHPITGKMVRMKRPSTYGSEIADSEILTEWKLAMGIMGTANDEGLEALAQSEPIPTEPIHLRQAGWWMPWAKIGHMGMDAARSKHGAHLGTAVHTWTERLEKGEIQLSDIPKKWRLHGEHFLRVQEEHELNYHSWYSETLVCETELFNTRMTKGLCGRLDRLRSHPSGWLFVDDTKTGRQAPKGVDEIAIQEAVYANSPWHWNETLQKWVPAPPNINKDIGFITHVPIDHPERAKMIPIDLKWGWAAAQLVAEVLYYRNRAKRKTNGLRLREDILSTIPPYQAPGPVTL